MPKTEFGPNLTSMTSLGRQAVKFGIIGLVVLIVGRTLATAAINFWKAANPPPPPAPTMGFGILPALQFPPNLVTKPQSYTLEMAGRLPSFGDRAKVFLMPRSSLTLSSDDKVRKLAAKYGFVFAPEILDSQTYRWSKSQPLESTLEIDAVNLTFELQTNFMSRPELLDDSQKLRTGAQATEQVKSFLSGNALLPTDLATASAKITYLKALGSDLQAAASLSDADFIQVDLDRYPIDSQFASYGPDGTKGAVHAIVSGGLKGSDSIVRMEYNYYPVDYLQVHTYPLRSTDSAWKILQAGEGYIANPGAGPTAVIRKVTLGYFESFTEQTYFQPIYVFTGDNGFVGYVPAIDPKLLSTASSTP